RLRLRQDVKRAPPRSHRGDLDRDLLPDLSDMLVRDFAFRAVAKLTGNEELVSTPREGNVVAGRHDGGRQNVTRSPKALLDGIHVRQPRRLSSELRQSIPVETPANDISLAYPKEFSCSDGHGTGCPLSTR